MKFAVLISLLVAAGFGLEPTILAGTKTEGSICRQPNECVEPFYCLKVGGSPEYTCEKKTCGGQEQCRIGQYCDDESKKCAVKGCAANSECPGNTVCYVDGSCTSPGTSGQACTRSDQCWGDCVNGACTRGSGSADKGSTETGGKGDGAVSSGAAASPDAGTGSSAEEDEEAPAEESVEPEDDGSSLGGGAITGIVLGILAALAILAVICWCLGMKKEEEEEEAKEQA